MSTEPTSTERGPAGPVLSRRRELGGASARSLLMTLLGEFVLPRDGEAWTSALIRTLAVLGVEEKSARQALARTAAEGWLTAHRQGRRVRWQLTQAGGRLLTEGAQRIYSFGARPQPWDQTWLVIIITAPELRREQRHRLRTRLAWAGFGSPAPDVWITPVAGREAEASQILAELGLAGQAMSLRASYGAIGQPASVVARAWDLDAVVAGYDAFIGEFAGLRPGPGNPSLIAQTRLVHEWRRFPFLDPQLPAELLPAQWSGTRAAALFHASHEAWAKAAQARWDELAAAPA